MQLALSDIIGKKSILLPGGETVMLSAIFIDSRNGRALSGKCSLGFLPFQQIVPKENSWEFRGEVKRTTEGENWLGFRVENRRGLKRGRVAEIWFDSGTFQASKLECRRQILGIWQRKRVFSADDIFEIIPLRKLIVVEEENRVFRKAEATLAELQNIPAAVNPTGCTTCGK